MKNLKQNTLKVIDEIMLDLNETLKKFNLGDVHIESFKLKQGNYQLNNCSKVCQIYTDPRTGQKKIICKMVCPK